jgi:zinc D-Ala-D-Ala carboxypeptidase
MEKNMEDQRLSEHFTLREFTRSQAAERLGIDNRPNEQEIANLKLVAGRLEIVRVGMGARIFVTSGFRCRQLNTLIGGSPNSDHVLGGAADFTVEGHGNADMIRWIMNHPEIQFDQLIYEFGERGWVHLGIGPGRASRRQVLTAMRDGGRVIYRQGLILD